jgi:hypothetical protein
MSILSSNCKINPDCDIVVPIDEYASIGDSISAMNLNFRNLDITSCNLLASAADLWSPAYLTLNTLSGDWLSMLTTIETYSSCWNTTYDTVKSLSAFWLKPISMIYPYPFEEDVLNPETTVEAWVNETFPVRTNDCFNFIVGQEMYIFTPEYTEINRFVTADSELFDLDDPVASIPGKAGIGLRKPNATEAKKHGEFLVKRAENSYRITMMGQYSCISRVTPLVIRVDFSIDSIGSVGVVVPDKFINKIVGLKFKIDPETYTWSYAENIYNTV